MTPRPQGWHGDWWALDILKNTYSVAFRDTQGYLHRQYTAAQEARVQRLEP